MVDDVREEVILKPILDVSGGVNNYLFSGNIGDNQSVAQKNMNISKPGTRRKRDGYALIANDAGAGDKARVWNFRPDTIAERLIMYSDNDLFEWTGSGNWVSIGTANATDARMDAFQADNRIYFLIDGSIVQSWNGTTLTNEGDTNTDPPKGSTGVYKFQRAFIAGVSAFPHLVYYSNQATGTGVGSTFWNRSANNVQIKGIGSGDRIVKVIDFRQSDLIVFTRSSIWSIDISNSTPSSWVVKEVHPSIGCGSRDSVRAVGNDIMFMDQNGKIRSLLRTAEDLNQGVNPIPTSQPIEGHTDTFAEAYIANAAAEALERFYFLSVTLNGTENDSVFIYDTVTEAWTGPWTNWYATNLVISRVAGGKDVLYFGNSASLSKVFKYSIGTFTDAGTAIEYQETSKKYDMGSNRLDKLWQSIEIIAESTGNSTITVECQINDSGFVTVGTMNLTGGGPSLPVDYPFTLGDTGFVRKIFPIDALLGPGRYLQYRLTHSDSGQQCKIISVTLSAYIENIVYGET